ncbi:hypothetical protein XENOCAPTIV_009035 [Xenoophorus captivus]|uniref:Uncharacterized protein n=1 Tax=Xenoophorus captivus TaxID=1517983 RepID=A0ABV0QCX0_9TELE
MAQRLRLYFGSGRSNTAPEMLGTDSEEGQVEGEAARLRYLRPPPLPRPPQESAMQHVPSGTFGLHSEPSLKRSSSMFIPQLTTYPEPRPTKSSSVQISLQRCNGSISRDSGALVDDVPPPLYTPPGPAPAYPEPQIQEDFPRQPPPPYYSPDSLNSQSLLNEPNLPKRRVFSIGSSGYRTFSGGQPGVSVGTICIQRNSPEIFDVQHFRILPYGGDGQQQSLEACAGSDNQQRQINQEAHRVFRARRHISEDLENERLDSRDMDNSWELITEEDPNDGFAQSLPAPSSILTPQHSPTPAAQEFSEDLNLRLSITPEMNGELPGPSSSLVMRNFSLSECKSCV